MRKKSLKEFFNILHQSKRPLQLFEPHEHKITLFATDPISYI